MEPQLPNPNFTPNQSKSSPETPKAEQVSVAPQETGPTHSVEQLGGRETKERHASSPRMPSSSVLPTVTAPLPVPAATSDDSDNNIAASTPIAAADDDVIEKEWVNKAKKVVSETKGDPYRQEREVSKLQADYMQKRYGKQVKMPEDD